jgi:DNA-binding transcriptional ArsR family regulator
MYAYENILNRGKIEMPFRKLVSKELSDLLKSLAHKHRLQIVEELGNREMDVNALQNILDISHSNVSQHLSVLRAHRIVIERREGRYVFYRLRHPELAVWLLEALKFLADDQSDLDEIREAIHSARQAWSLSSDISDKDL